MAKFGRDVCRGHRVMLKPVCTVIAAYIRVTTAKFGRDVCKGHRVMLKSVCTVIAAYIRATMAKFGKHVCKGHQVMLKSVYCHCSVYQSHHGKVWQACLQGTLHGSWLSSTTCACLT